MNISEASAFVPLRGITRLHPVSPTAMRPVSAPPGAGEASTEGGVPESGRMGSEVAGRLDAAVDKLREKLDQLSTGRELNEDQIARLHEAEEHLQATLDRIQNALQGPGLAPSTLRLGFRTAIGDVRAAVEDILSDGGAVGGVDDAPLPDPVALGQVGATVDAERFDGQDDQGPEDPVLRRIANAEERMSGRIDELLESPDLTDEQRSALSATRESFGATLDRLRNAMDGGVAPVTVARGFRTALGEFRQGERGALGAGGTGADAPGGAVDVIDPAMARRMEQLHEAGDRIDRRLENLMAREGLDEHQLAALEGARDEFQTSLAELRGSLLDSEVGVADVRRAFMEALDGLVEDVHGALHEQGPQPLVYTAAEGVETLDDAGSRSALDHTA